MITQHHQVILVNEPSEAVEMVIGALWERQPFVSVRSGSFSDADGASLVLYDAPAHADAGVDAVLRHTRQSTTPLAVFTATCCVDSAIEHFRAGARGYLSKAASPAQLAVGLDHLLAGHTAIDATLGGDLAYAIAHSPGAAWPGMASGLTRREGEVFKLLQRGLTNREIADRLIIGMQTVKSHAHTVYRKLGVNGRAELVL